MTFIRVLGLGTARPDGAILQRDAAAMAALRCCDTAEQARWLHNVYRQTSVRSRASVLLNDRPGANGNGSGNGHNHPRFDAFFTRRGEADERGPSIAARMAEYVRRAPPLAEEAATRALEVGSVLAREVTQLVLVSCTGFSAPGVDTKLIESLGLPRTIGRTVVGFMGCHGAINGLRVAQALATSGGGDARVLLCCVELCSLHFQYGWDPQRIVANALFADGAAAAILRADTGPAARGAWRLAACGSCLLPDSHGDMTWTIADHGFEMTLAPRVPALVEAHVRPWLTEWLAAQGLAIGDVGSWAVHPGGPKVITAVEDALGLPPSATQPSRDVLAECGNMSSPTILFILERLRAADAPLPCVALAFGPGLTIEAALFV